MGRISGLVPSRFLTLLAHLESNIQACLPLKFTPEEYEKQDNQSITLSLCRLVAALCLTLGLFAVELAGFLSGVSMFNSTQSLLSIAAHCSASVALSFFIFERWECTTYWYIFAFCRLFWNGGWWKVYPKSEGFPHLDLSCTCEIGRVLKSRTHPLTHSHIRLGGLSVWVGRGSKPTPYFHSAFPAVTETALFIAVFGLKKKPF
ncbi:transmembrane protein 107 isoform X2 [Rattus norvegicus]